MAETTEIQETKKAKFTTHQLVDWTLLAIALVVVLGGAGYYLNSVYNQTSLELSDTYRQDVVIPEKTESTQVQALNPTTDTDLKETDKLMNSANTENFNDTTLNDKSVGL